MPNLPSALRRASTKAGPFPAALLAAAVVAGSSGAGAQQPPPADPQGPPPGYGQAPPGYGQPPPGYPPPGYGAPPPGYGYGYYPPPPGYGAPQGPKRLDYEDGDPVPPGYHVESKMRKGLAITGLALLGGFWLVSCLVAGTVQDNSSSGSEWTPLYIPVAGPFIAIGTLRSRNGGTFALVLDGIAQAGGLAMGIAGLASSQTQLVRDDVGLSSVRVSPVAAIDAEGRPAMGLGFRGAM